MTAEPARVAPVLPRHAAPFTPRRPNQRRRAIVRALAGIGDVAAFGFALRRADHAARAVLHHGYAADTIRLTAYLDTWKGAATDLLSFVWRARNALQPVAPLTVALLPIVDPYAEHRPHDPTDSVLASRITAAAVRELGEPFGIAPLERGAAGALDDVRRIA